MTASVLRPHAADEPVANRYPYLDNSRREGNLFVGAVVVALSIHIAAVWIPLPSRAMPVAPDPRPEPTTIKITPLTPPPPPEPVRVPDQKFQPPKDSIPVPAPPDHLDPVVERPVTITDEPIAIDTEVMELAAPEYPPAAPAPPAIVDESHAGLEVPVALSKPSPVYPRAAVTVRAEAEVILEAIVDTDGNVTDIRLISVTGGVDLGFSEAAIDAVSRWVYRPGTIEGRPVAVRLTVRVSFNLR